MWSELKLTRDRRREGMAGILDIRYSELRFTIRMVQASRLPRFKASAIRGGMGDMLLNEYCVREQIRKENDNKCDLCDYLDECIVQRILYSKLDIVPAFMSSGNSVGYIVECLDIREEFEAGGSFQFKLILFGKNCYYLSQYLSMIYRLGITGLGRDAAQFEVISVRNMRNEEILSGNDIYNERYRIDKISDYVSWRKSKLKEMGASYQIHIRYKTPIAIKKNGEFQKELKIEDLIDNLNRRIYSLNCFEGSEYKELLEKQISYPVMTGSENNIIYIPRYSFRKEQKIFLEGIYGYMDIDISVLPDKDDLISRLLAGEVLHIGSNTSFGFGGYELEIND